MNFVKKSIRNKLVILLLAATIIPIVTSMLITYQYTKQYVKKRNVVENTNLISQGKRNIMFYFDMINKASLSIYNSTISGIDLYKTIERDSKVYTMDEQISMNLMSIYKLSKEIYQVNLYINRSNRSYLMLNNILLKGGSVYIKIDPLIPGSYYGFIESSHPVHHYGVYRLENEEQGPLISFHRPIYQIPSTKLLGILSIDIKIEALRNISKQLYTKGEEDIYIINNRDGAVIYASQESEIGTKIDTKWLNYLNKQQNATGSFEWKSSEFKGINIYERMQTNYMDWTLVKRVPYTYLYKSATELTQINIIVGLIFLIIVVGTTIYISIDFTAPIKQLIGYIEKIKMGDLQVDIKVERQDEFGILERHFREMMKTINSLILYKYQLELANKTNQLKVLQAQINPHFIYNALQSIGTLALKQNVPQVYSLLYSLGRMMRYNINTNEYIVTLSKEIEHVKTYLDLQKQRFEERLRVDFDLDERTYPVKVPKMILQPLVENYFKHGFSLEGEEGQLLIESKIEENNELKICIQDNGTGIEKEKLKSIQQQLERETGLWEEGEEHVGLLNVLTRLKLYVNEQVRMELTPVEPKGLAVTLWIPIREGEEKNESINHG